MDATTIASHSQYAILFLAHLEVPHTLARLEPMTHSTPKLLPLSYGHSPS